MYEQLMGQMGMLNSNSDFYRAMQMQGMRNYALPMQEESCLSTNKKEEINEKLLLLCED